MGAYYSRMNSKGQLLIPVELRLEMTLAPGTKVSIRREGNKIVMRPLTANFIGCLVGCTRGAGAERERTHSDDEKL